MIFSTNASLLLQSLRLAAATNSARTATASLAAAGHKITIETFFDTCGWVETTLDAQVSEEGEATVYLGPLLKMLGSQKGPPDVTQMTRFQWQAEDSRLSFTLGGDSFAVFTPAASEGVPAFPSPPPEMIPAPQLAGALAAVLPVVSAKNDPLLQAVCLQKTTDSGVVAVATEKLRLALYSEAVPAAALSQNVVAVPREAAALLLAMCKAGTGEPRIAEQNGRLHATLGNSRVCFAVRAGDTTEGVYWDWLGARANMLAMEIAQTAVIGHDAAAALLRDALAVACLSGSHIVSADTAGDGTLQIAARSEWGASAAAIQGCQGELNCFISAELLRPCLPGFGVGPLRIELRTRNGEQRMVTLTNGGPFHLHHALLRVSQC